MMVDQKEDGTFKISLQEGERVELVMDKLALNVSYQDHKVKMKALDLNFKKHKRLRYKKTWSSNKPYSL